MNGSITDTRKPAVTPSRSGPAVNKGLAPVVSGIPRELAQLRAILAEAQAELARARQIRTAVEQYQKEAELRARSQAQQVVLEARLAVRKEIAELKCQTRGEIKHLLNDICMLRDAALAELEAQRKFADAARIMSLSLALEEKGKATVTAEEGVLGIPARGTPDKLLALLDESLAGQSCQLSLGK